MTDVASWITTLERNLTVLARQAEGVPQQASLRSLYPGGSSFNWLIGHLAVSRDAMLDAAGAETLAGEGLVASYSYGSTAPGEASAHDVGSLLDLLRQQGEKLASALASLDDRALAAPSGRGDQSVEAFVTFMLWHESYHLGQAALYRGALGLDSVIG